jgi:hypothetical protein
MKITLKCCWMGSRNLGPSPKRNAAQWG